MKRDIRVLNYDSATKEFTFDWNSSSSDIRGRDRIVQMIVKRILTFRGSNVLSPNYGENFYELFGVADPSKNQEALETVPVLLKSMEERIILEQSLDDTITPSERLASLELDKLEYDEFSGTWFIGIQIETQDKVKSSFRVN